MRAFAVFLLAAAGIFIVDQGIKNLFLEGYYRSGMCIDLALHFNKGVAFSMFAFLGDYLKWIQSVLVLGILSYVLYGGYIKTYAFALGLLIGGALGNLYDRFVHGGVVDYVAWHCGFDFAVFNFADVAIDLAVVLILAKVYFFPPAERDR
ncbi:Lipoprotein signal peptidase [hydrothermal vent metagenome]|uniref:Lipoprotein signal peptidase n=1 Tax=hydrothermal vent metagenome TaxID=652676 RepID=A0A1W1E992_9ZZZZ